MPLDDVMGLGRSTSVGPSMVRKSLLSSLSSAETETAPTQPWRAAAKEGAKDGANPRSGLIGAPALSAAPARVLSIIETNPGSTIQQVATILGVAHATASYHLNVLRRLELIVQEREGREVRHFVVGGTRDFASRLRPVLSDPRRRAILEFLAAEPLHYLSVNQIAGRLGVNHGFLVRTLDQLVRMGVLRVGRRGNRYVLQPVTDIGKWITGTPAPI